MLYISLASFKGDNSVFIAIPGYNIATCKFCILKGLFV
jgi:hypothetical protein